MSNFTGVQVLHVDPEAIEKIYALKTMSFDELQNYMVSPEDAQANGLAVPSNEWRRSPNMCLVLTAFQDNVKTTAIVRVGHRDDSVWLLKDFSKTPVYDLKPRNKEQNMLLNTLTDDRIKCQVIVGRAGSGKTICALAYALQQLFEVKNSRYERVILTRPMSSVGKEMGAFPGEASEKFTPYLGNFYDNLSQLMGRNGTAFLETAMHKGKIELKPIPLIGGSSWHNSIIIADEVQSLNAEEMYALGTRPAEGSKLILMGDYRQRYGAKISTEQTGLFKLVNSPITRKSPVISAIELLKTERGELTKLFSEVFEG